MISRGEQTTTTVNGGSWHDGFLDLFPRIAASARRHFRHLAAHAREEAVCEVVAHSCIAYRRLVELGKSDVAYAGPLARFAIASYRRGRRVGSRQNSRDITSPICQGRHHVRCTQLRHWCEQSGAWRDLVIEDRRSTPADVAATRVDFHA